MNIVRRLSDGLVQAEVNGVYEFTNNYLEYNNTKVLDINNVSHELISVNNYPEYFMVGSYYYNNGIWTVADQLSIDELVSKVTNKLINSNFDRYERNGTIYFRETRNLIQRSYSDGVISRAQFLGMKQALSTALQPLKDGDWDIAQENINQIARPTNVKLALLYDTVKKYIDNYIITNNIT